MAPDGPDLRTLAVKAASYGTADLQLVYDELVREVLADIPTYYGRLVYLSSLRDANTGGYEHFVLAGSFGESLANAGLQAAHVRIYRDWLALNLEQQKADLILYLVSLTSDKRQILRTWLITAPYRALIPLHTQPVEKDIFLTDLQTLLSLLMNELAIDGPEGAA